jgi:sec-independent protein translocase protein TatB
MFDVSFWELVVVATVALLVVGPERLPGLARDAARWLRAVRRYANQVRSDIERELDLDGHQEELRRNIARLDQLMKDAPDRDEKRGQDP